MRTGYTCLTDLISSTHWPVALTLITRASCQVFNVATSLGFSMSVLDIGGGFGGQLGPNGRADLGAVPAAVNGALGAYFPPGCGVTFMAEPGRYFAEAPSTLACAGKRGIYIALQRGRTRACLIREGFQQTRCGVMATQSFAVAMFCPL
jgi:diaminopimelate decarboxylase